MIYNTIINRKWLKEVSPYPLNYDTKEIENYIKLGEDIWLVPIIGREWYDELVDEVSRNELSEENSTALVEAIYPYLGFAICYEALPMTWAHINEVGITKGKSDNADSLSLKDITYIQNHIRNQVEVRKEYLIKWLMEHSEYFPKVWGCECECSCRMSGGKNPNKNQQLYSTYRECTDIY